MIRITLLLAVFCQFGISQQTNNIKLLIKEYETNLNSSISLERSDEELRVSWGVEYLMNAINVTTKYRMQMTRHREHSFQRTEFNEKWSECLNLHRRQIRSCTRNYLKNESECLRTTSVDAEARGVEQLEKEIKKWRIGYRYLVRTCKADNPADKEAFEVCLVQYMERDNFNQVIRRLIILKLEAMGLLHLKMTTSLASFEECLKNQLSTFLEQVRQTMDTLYKCYALKTNENS